MMNVGRLHLRLLLLLLTLSHPQAAINGAEEELSEYVVSECYGDIFNFDCGRGNKIRINKDFFGFSKGRKCRYTKGECIISNPKSNSLIHRFCTGHRVCTYYLVERRGCGGSFSNYQQVEYQCISDSTVTNICSTVDYKATSTYIASPNFPENYPPGLNCRCVVSATSARAKVRMEIVYLAIKYTQPCRDWLSIGMRRTCGTTMDLFQGRRIPIEFRSDAEDSHSGFWLHFKSSLPGEEVHVQCGNITLHPPSPRPATRHHQAAPSANKDGGRHVNSSDDQADHIQRTSRPEDSPGERPLTTGAPARGSTEQVTRNSPLTTAAPADVTPRATDGGHQGAPARPTPRREGEAAAAGGERERSAGDDDDDDTLHGRVRWSDGSHDGPIPGHVSQDAAVGATRQGGGRRDTVTGSTSPPVPSRPPGGGGDAGYNISRLDDAEVWPGGRGVNQEGGYKDTETPAQRSPLQPDNNDSSSAVDNVTVSQADPPQGENTNTVNTSLTQGPVLSTTVPSIVRTKTTTDSFVKLGTIIVSVCVGVGLLLVCATLLIIYLRKHAVRDEETQTPRQKNAGDGDSGTGLLASRSSLPSSSSALYGAGKVDKSLQTDLDSEADDDDGAQVGACAAGLSVEKEESFTSHYEPNCKGVQVTARSLAQARFRDRKRRRNRTLVSKSGTTSVSVSVDTTEGSSSECTLPHFRPLSDLSGSSARSEADLEVEHKSSLASMSQYSEVTLVPESAVLPPGEEEEYYDSFSDPDWDQKSAISI